MTPIRPLIMKIVQIVPRLPPEVCGVGDYSLALAHDLQAKGIETTFVVGKSEDNIGNQTPNGFDTYHIQRRSADSLQQTLSQIDFDAIVLQYSGYGYAKRGAPLWLSEGLGRIRRPILTMFHELYAFSSPWSSAFWLCPLMKFSARRIAKMSSVRFTNRQASANWLQLPTKVVPVFSNFGEPEVSKVPMARERSLVCFGYQADAFPMFLGALRVAIDQIKPTRLISIGRRTERLNDLQGLCPTEWTGVLSGVDISKILQESRFGFLAYHSEYLGKSGILASYAAHGVCPILAGTNKPLSDGLVFGKNIASPWDCGGVSVESIVEASQNWYSNHSIEKTAELYSKALIGLMEI